MLNSEKFLQTFSSIEKWLKTLTSSDRREPFYRLVDLASRKNRAVNRYRDDLKEFADLRNAIVHERSDGHVIAEPNERALRDFQRLESVLLEPPKVIPKFQIDVRTRSVEESVGDAVTDMRTGSFSQLPVLRNDEVVEVLTAETVVRWLASEFANELVVPWETQIEEVLPHTEDKDHYGFLSRDATVLDVVSVFREFAERGKDLDAILLSHDGSRSQQLLGIVTVYDLPELLGSLDFRKATKG